MIGSVISDKLRELILDENKIVTYKYLSKVCSIHVNSAKRALEQFLDSEGNLNATYYLSGFIKQENDSKNAGYLVAVVPCTQLEKAKCTFSKLDNCHVYSVQKTVIKDSCVIYASSCDESEISDKERPKPVIRNENLKSSRPAQLVKSSATKQSMKTETIKQTTLSNNGNCEEEPEVKSGKTLDKPAPSKATSKGKGRQPSKKAGIMAAFAKEATKKKSLPSAPKENEKTVTEPSPIEEKESPPNGSKVKVGTDTKTKRNGHSESRKKFKKIEKQMWSSSESSSEDETTPPPKRSKTLNRIKQLPESDSDEEQMKNETPLVSSSEEPNSKGAHMVSDDDNENVIPPTPEDNKTSRQYVTVTNTYQDEGGFLVTRKERKLEEVSLPESSPSTLPDQGVKRTLSDGNLKQKPSAPPSKSTNKGKGKSAPDSGKKQASLMSFFTKK